MLPRLLAPAYVLNRVGWFMEQAMSAVGYPGSRSTSHQTAANAATMVPLSSLLYESRSTATLTEHEVQQLVASAEARNLKEGVTGLLLYDEGRFFQWLEGPTEGLGRVWHSIRNDRRHTAITVLGETTTPVRLFGSSPMTLGKRRGDGTGGSARRSAIDPASILRRIPLTGSSILAGMTHLVVDQALEQAARMVKANRGSLRAVVEGLIVPELLARHSTPALLPVVIDPRAAELARLLLAAKPTTAFALIDSVRADGRSMMQLCAGLFEPAARALGDLWMSDDCIDIEVTLGLGHLRAALRRISDDTSFTDGPRLHLPQPHAVLVAPSPREPHLLGSAIASEMFWRAGWEVRCEFPDSDAVLSQLVRERWFDVLDLSLSAAFGRKHRLPAMAASIRAARANSLNPALTVIVNGRVFYEGSQADTDVSADGSVHGAQGLVSTALTQMQRRRPEDEVEQRHATPNAP